MHTHKHLSLYLWIAKSKIQPSKVSKKTKACEEYPILQKAHKEKSVRHCALKSCIYIQNNPNESIQNNNPEKLSNMTQMLIRCTFFFLFLDALRHITYISACRVLRKYLVIKQRNWSLGLSWSRSLLTCFEKWTALQLKMETIKSCDLIPDFSCAPSCILPHIKYYLAVCCSVSPNGWKFKKSYKASAEKTHYFKQYGIF